MVNIAFSLIDIFVCDEKEGVISQQWGPGNCFYLFHARMFQ